MAELDKKIQKSQADLVQLVLEAQEKKNQERVDMLITNAIKQLKISRFKPDQTACLSLTYLARVNSKVFMQSSAIKEVLKSLLRRDNGPTNIKGVGKSDIMLPVMAANILLACCDGTEVRTIILNKIDQWLTSSQKVAEIVQHLLAIICLKSQGDQQTIGTLIEMRHHWLQYIDENFLIYGQVPSDICESIRKLLKVESSCESLISYLRFLIKHDSDIEGLGQDLSNFIINRPISISSMMKSSSGVEMNKLLLKIYIKLITYLKSSPAKSDEVMNEKIKFEKPADDQLMKDAQASDPPIKAEPGDTDISCDDKKEVKVETKPNLQSTNGPGVITDASKKEPVKDDIENETIDQQIYVPSLYVKFVDSNQVVRLDRSTIEAVFTLLSMVDNIEECNDEFTELIHCWLSGPNSAMIFMDLALTSPYNMPDKLRKKLIHSSSEPLVNLGLHGASAGQLVKLLQQFNLPTQTINKMLKRIETIRDVEQFRLEIKDVAYFSQLVEFYMSMGCQGAKDLLKRLELAV